MQDAPVVNAGNAASFVREHRPDDIPFAVAEFISHDTKLRFWSLNHDSNIPLCWMSAFGGKADIPDRLADVR